MEVNINLDKITPPTFRWVDNQILNSRADEVIKEGGRGTGKSQGTANIITLGCTINNESAIALVKYANKIPERLVSVFVKSLKLLNLEHKWKLRKSPYELVMLDDLGNETDTSIKFVGCDNADSIKSYKSRKGEGFRYIWFEEVTNFSGRAEINSLVESFGRQSDSVVVFTYNPPMSTSSWVNKEFSNPDHCIYNKNNIKIVEETLELDGKEQVSRKIIHHSTYQDLINTGFGHYYTRLQLNNIARAQKYNPRFYRWCYLGEPIGTEANVFSNIVDWDGDTSGLNMRETYRGFDWGYGGSDTSAFIHVYYDRLNNDLYLLDEFGKPKMDIPDIVSEIVKHNKNNFPIYGDSGVPLLNTQLQNKNINILPVKKGPDSVRAGITFLQSLNHIYICSKLTPQAYGELVSYEYIVDKEGKVTSELPDKNNHFIDAIRYALSVIIRTSGFMHNDTKYTYS